MNIEELCDIAVSEAKKLNVDDAVSLSILSDEKIIRFANNSLTVVKNVSETELFVYLAKDKRRIIASTSNPEEANVREFVRNLCASLSHLSQNDYGELPKESYRYKISPASYDKKIEECGDKLPELAKAAISAAMDNGAERSAGAIAASVVTYWILTTSGTEGSDKRASINLNIRSFANAEASGHGLACSSSLSEFKPEDAGARAGKAAKSMINAKEVEQGRYEILMSPTVASNLINLIGVFSSAFNVETGVSYLAGKLGKRVASDIITLIDHGTTKGCLGGRQFDDEGMPTQSTVIIRSGMLMNYLHNLTTAKKFKTNTTGNAGIIEPEPWNLEVKEGNSSYEEMVREMKRGLIITSNWYTRFKNYRTGEFSTVPRDAAYLVENGEIVRPVRGMRISDTLERMFSSVKLVSREREWIKWWEVDIPTLCPWILTEGVNASKAFD